MARILVVDDEETIRYAFEILLANEGHTVTVAGSYGDALERMAESAFDLVFADIVLGDRSGIDILGIVQERDPSCPVVMITGSPDFETASQAIRLSAFDYIPKPVLQMVLLDVTARALRHKALVDEKERYRSHLEAIFASVKDSVIAVDKNLAVTGVNEAAAEICGLSRDAVGKTFGSLQRCSGGTCLGLLTTIINDGKSVTAQRIECRRDGRPKRIVSIDASPLLDGRSILSGAVLVVKDETRLDNLERDLEERRQFHNFIGKSAKMQQIYAFIEDLANVPTTVLITGETGTGKELGAAALHHKGDRRDKPFVKVNCSALSESLLESELFGHVRGAFTGALQNKIGRFERADGGTLFLDEIGDLSPTVQLRLLRVLQEKEFERVGDSRPIKVDVRIVAATNKDLREKVKRGEFRDDLYYRLKVVEIHLPPLRERRGDLPLLADHFLKKFNKSFGKEIASLSADVQKVFMDYSWPGNVRELEHTLEHACIVCNQRMITVDHLPCEFRDFMETGPSVPEERSAHDRATIINALGKTDGNKAKAARLLGISRQTMYRRIEENMQLQVLRSKAEG